MATFLPMRRVFEFRLFPTQGQQRALDDLFETLRLFYNAALQERRQAWNLAKEQAAASGEKPTSHVSLASQEKAVKFIKDLCPEYDAIHTHLYQDTLSRLDRAFDSFFARHKAGLPGGFPRFKPFGRLHSFTFKDAAHGNGCKLLGIDEPERKPAGVDRPAFRPLHTPEGPHWRLVAAGKRLYLHGIGKVRIKLHRPFQGKVKQVRVVKRAGQWFAQLVCDGVAPRPLPATGKSTGIDVGITTFATMSDGSEVDNPRLAETAQPQIRKLQKTVSRRKKGSHRRKKAIGVLARAQARVADKRKQFHHTTAKEILETYDAVAVEDLNVKGLARGMLAKWVHDAGWSQFLTILANKAERAGRVVERVKAAGTTQECSGCGEVVRKGLHVREHRCPWCGLELGRDHNAARNVEKRGRDKAFGERAAVGPSENREAPTSPNGQVGE